MRLFARCASAALLLIVPLCAVPNAVAQAGSPGRAAPAPLYRSAQAVPGQYIVTLAQDAAPDAVLEQLDLTPMFTYSDALNGFAAGLDPDQLATVRDNPAVAAVEENSLVFAGEIGAGPAATTSWGLDRIDQHALPLDDQFTATGTGAGTTAYIVDTGIDYPHSEFGGRAVPGYDAIGDGGNGQDCSGHGTHVAGTVGGATFGVANKTALVSVRVLNCEGKGTGAGIIAGFDWIARNGTQPAVVNASFGGPASASVDNAVNALADKGFLPVVAAGNDAIDACGVSPARAVGVVTVGATDRSDKETAFSNHGGCLSLYAPGSGIVSALLGGGSATGEGTSMATPHVTGVVALYKAANPNATPAAISAWLAQQSTKDVLDVSAGSPDSLLYTAGL